MGHDENNKLSIFNAGVSLAQRIDELQRAINAAKYNPVSFNPEVSKFNYEIMLTSNDLLFNCAWSKLKSIERERGEKLRKIVHKLVELNPIVTQHQNDIKVNRTNLKKFLDLFLVYERAVLEFLEAHDLQSPNKDTDGDDEL